MINVTARLPDVVRIKDVARALCVHDRTVRNMLKRGDLPKQRKVGRALGYWLAADIAHLISAGTQSDANKAA